MTNGRDCDQSHEKEALQWAIEYFKGHADYGSLRPGGRQKEELDNMLRLARQGLLFDSDEQVRDYIELATAGDNSAKTLLLETVARYADWGLPPDYWGPLRDYAIKFLRNPEPSKKRPGRKRSELRQRDNAIFYAAWRINRQWGFSPTRNVLTRNRPSATSIVKEALEEVAVNLSEDDVVKIWRAHKKELDRWASERNTGH
jgi:hypothetical protein